MMYKSQFLSISLLFSILSTYQNINSNCDTSNVTIPVEITSENFDKEVLQAEIPVMLYTYTSRFWFCSEFMPLSAEFCQEFAGKIKLVAMDMDKNSTLPNELGECVLPAFFLFYKGVLLGWVTYDIQAKEVCKELCENAVDLCARIDKIISKHKSKN